jgi:hypothetical protein
MKRIALSAALVAGSLAPLAAQGNLVDRCNQPPVSTNAAAQQNCYVVVQAAESGQPQLGILLAGGNPTIGTASTGGLRLGLVPRVSASVKLNVVGVSLPDIREFDPSGTVPEDELNVPVPAISGTVSVGVFPGVSLAPTLGGFGALDLLGTATYVPFDLAEDGTFDEASSTTAWGVGGRVGILRESLLTPGVSVSVMYRNLGEVAFGQVCTGEEVAVFGDTDPRRACVGPDDLGEFHFDLRNWSTRAAVSKRLMGLGLTAGVGHDSFKSDGEVAFRSNQSVPCGTTTCTVVYRFEDLELDNSRWSAFANASFTLFVASIGAEVGWMSGGDRVAGFPSTSDFDPKGGTLFGSVGLRIGF